MEATLTKNVKVVGVGPWGSPDDLAEAVNRVLADYTARDRLHHAVVLDISYSAGRVSTGTNKPEVLAFHAIITLKVP